MDDEDVEVEDNGMVSNKPLDKIPVDVDGEDIESRFISFFPLMIS